jgi:hypothetical protein
VTGVQTVYLVNESVPWINLNWFELNLLSSGGATATPTPEPTATPTTSGAPWLRIEAETYTSAASGVYFGFTDDVGGGQAVYDFDTPRWIAFENVDLQGGVIGFRLRGDSAGSGDVTLRVGSPTGTVVCTLAWTPGGTYYTTRETACASGVTGVQTLYLRNDSVPWVNLNWFEIQRSP